MGKRSRGLTLIEIIIAIAILLLLIMVIFGILGVTQLKKSRDARRKTDLNKIAKGFEDYFNDNNCYPENLEIFKDCGGTGFRPWLNFILCDPLGYPYKIVIDDQNCPHWFKIYANLEYEKDIFIREAGCGSGCWVDNETFNYGTSSPNVSIGTGATPTPTEPISPTSSPPPPSCIAGCCWQTDKQGECNGPRAPGETCFENCYNDKDCSPSCYLPEGCDPTRTVEDCLRAVQGI